MVPLVLPVLRESGATPSEQIQNPRASIALQGDTMKTLPLFPSLLVSPVPLHFTNPKKVKPPAVVHAQIIKLQAQLCWRAPPLLKSSAAAVVFAALEKPVYQDRQSVTHAKLVNMLPPWELRNAHYVKLGSGVLP